MLRQRTDFLVCAAGAAGLYGLDVTPVRAERRRGPSKPQPSAPDSGSNTGGSAYRRPVRVASRSEVAAPLAELGLRPGDPNEHPLMPALRWARDGLTRSRRSKTTRPPWSSASGWATSWATTSTCSSRCVTSRSASTCTSSPPPRSRDRRSSTSKGANNGKMWAHGVGIQETMFGTVSLEPDGVVAMHGQRYPLDRDWHPQPDPAAGRGRRAGHEVRRVRGEVFQGREDQRPRLHLHRRSTHPKPRKNFLFHIARIFVDDQLNVPIRYEAYEWPKAARRPAGTDRRVHLPQPEVEQRLHRRRFRHAQRRLPLPLKQHRAGGQTGDGLPCLPKSWIRSVMPPGQAAPPPPSVVGCARPGASRRDAADRLPAGAAGDDVPRRIVHLRAVEVSRGRLAAAGTGLRGSEFPGGRRHAAARLVCAAARRRQAVGPLSATATPATSPIVPKRCECRTTASACRC